MSYQFSYGKYRAYVKTEFQNQGSGSGVYGYSKIYDFTCTDEDEYYAFQTNPLIKVNVTQLASPDATLIEEGENTTYGLKWRKYDNGLIIVFGTMLRQIGSGNPLPTDALYVYYAGQQTYYKNLFYNFESALDIAVYDSNLRSNVSAEAMFQRCINMIHVDLSHFSASNITSMQAMFSMCQHLTSINLNNLDTSAVTTTYNMFYRCERLDSVDLSRLNLTRVTTMMDMFDDCYALRSVKFNRRQYLTATNYSGMFVGCSSLQTFDDLYINAASCNLTFIFSGCSSLKEMVIHFVQDTNVSVNLYSFAQCYSVQKADFRNAIASASFDLSGVTSDIREIRCPKTLRGTIVLPKTMYDTNGTAHTTLPDGNITLYSITPRA